MKNNFAIVGVIFISLAGFIGCSKTGRVITLAVLTTTSVSNIDTTTATSGGNISSDGGASIRARGVCWNTSPMPTVAMATKTTDSSGTGSFTSNITGLSANTTYYVRSYATNSTGTAYGAELIFTTKLIVGQGYGGGYVVYILQPGDLGYDPVVLHGLIVAPTDQGVGVRWRSGDYIITGATGTAVGTGLSNTNAIIAVQGIDSDAASICKYYNGGGHTDWYLASKDELNKVYLAVHTIGDTIGGFWEHYYWSSSEFDIQNAYQQYFYGGLTKFYDKHTAAFVRAVRSF